MSFVSFDSIVAITNLLYSLGVLLGLAAFVWLRAKRLDMPRPYHVPMGTMGVAAMCTVPSVFLVLVMPPSGGRYAWPAWRSPAPMLWCTMSWRSTRPADV
jgi:amino acid transporter